MNWKYEAMDKLRGYDAHKAALYNLPREIERLEIDCASLRSASTDKTPVSSSKGNANEDKMLSNIVQREELTSRLDEARLWVETVDRALDVLGDEEQAILDACYMRKHRGCIRELCEQLRMEKSTVYRKRNNALRRFTIALYGVTETV